MPNSETNVTFFFELVGNPESGDSRRRTVRANAYSLYDRRAEAQDSRHGGECELATTNC